MALVLEHVESPTDDARALIGELDAELSGPYSAEQRHGLSIERVFRPGILFFIARLDGRAVGCGGVAIDDGFDARGGKVAVAIVARLEQAAREQGISRLVLETGDAQLAAIRFYEREGFTRCGAFGDYAAMAPHEIVRSVFFEKWIG